MFWQHIRLSAPCWRVFGIYLPLLLWSVLFPTAALAVGGHHQSQIPIAIVIDRFTYDDVENQYLMTISINWPSEVKRLRLLIQEADGGKDIDELSLTVNNRSILQTSFTGTPLEEGREYQLIIQGENLRNEVILKPDGNGMDSIAERMILDTRSFKHEPSSVTGIPVNIKSVNVDWNRQHMLIDLNLSTQEWSRLERYQGYIKHKESGAQIYTIEPQVFQILKGLTIVEVIPPAMQNEIEPQSYELFLTLTTSDDFESTNETPYEFTPPILSPPSRWQRIYSTLSTPWLLVGILFVIAVTTLWITIENNKEKELDSLPPAIDRTGRYTPYTPPPAADRTLRARIKLLQTPGENLFLDETVTDFPISIGREGCTINIAGDALISRRHVQIERHRDRLAIVDLKSRNGTTVANAQLVPEKPLVIKQTAVVTLGHHTKLQIDVVS